MYHLENDISHLKNRTAHGVDPQNPPKWSPRSFWRCSRRGPKSEPGAAGARWRSWTTMVGGYSRPMEKRICHLCICQQQSYHCQWWFESYRPLSRVVESGGQVTFLLNVENDRFLISLNHIVKFPLTDSTVLVAVFEWLMFESYLGLLSKSTSMLGESFRPPFYEQTTSPGRSNRRKHGTVVTSSHHMSTSPPC